MNAFIDEHRARCGVEPICSALQVAPSAYRRHAARLRNPALLSARARRDASLLPQLQRVYDQNLRVYGADKVWRQLGREGTAVARCTVERLMRLRGLQGARRGKKVRTTVPDAKAVCPLDRVNRQFSADRPNQLWVDTVGKRGQAGQDLQNVVSVAMLSEGWDAKNVTHIMGLRAFTSQLLCEQVIGRGLRRVSYDLDERGLYTAEYVNVFGVPLSIALKTGDGDGPSPPPPKNSTQVESLVDRSEFELRWPNILRIDAVVRPQLVVTWSDVAAQPLAIDPAQVPIRAEIAPALGGAAAWEQVTTVDLELLPEEFRLQRVVFKAAQRAFLQLEGRFKGQREYLLFQLVKLVEQFLDSRHIQIPSLFHQDPLRKRILFSLKIDAIVQYLLDRVQEQNTLKLEPVFDSERPIGSTRDMRTWYTTRISEPTKHSQVSHIVVDSSWEKYVSDLLEGHQQVAAWAKNDHLGFQVLYLWNGSKRKFIPDFLVRYRSGKTLVLEIKGLDSDQERAKRAALAQWVDAVNAHGGFGTWAGDVVVGEPAMAQDVIERHA